MGKISLLLRPWRIKMRGSFIQQVLQFIREILEWETNSYVDDMAEHNMDSTKIKTNKQRKKQKQKTRFWPFVP